MSKFIWFIGTAKAAVVVLLMMLVGFLTTTPDEVDNFLDGCIPNNPGCPKFELTVIDNVDMPAFIIPHFSIEYETCANQSSALCDVEIVQKDFSAVMSAIGVRVGKYTHHTC